LGPVIVVFTHRADELADLFERGLLERDWWRRVLDHEAGHHDSRWTRAGNQAHRDDAEDLLAELAAARAAVTARARKPPGSELAGGGAAGWSWATR